MVNDPYIKISIIAKAPMLTFSVENNFSVGNLSKDKHSGIGLTNVQNRLQLLYANNYELNITSHVGVYSVHLNCKLL
jgi:two-component system LytT family sensor kinase